MTITAECPTTKTASIREKALTRLRQSIKKVGQFEVVILAALVAIPLLFNVSFISARELLRDPDIWWHLADARYLFAHGFIRIEPYSFSVAGKPWANPEWLAELPFWFGFRTWGLRGLLFVTVALVELNLLAIYWMARKRSGHPWASFIAATIGYLLMTVNCGPRTILLGYLCLAVELMILDRAMRGDKRLLWALPPLFLIWVNLHGSWAIGAFVFLLYAGTRCLTATFGDLHSDRASATELKQLLAVGLLSIGVLFINPYGWHLVWNPFDMMFDQKLNIASAQEWHTLALTSFRGIVVTLLVGFLLFANAWLRRRWTIFEAALVSFGVFAAVDHVRFCFLLAVLATPTLALDLRRTILTKSKKARLRPLLNTCMAATILLIGIHRLPSSHRYQEAYAKLFPMKLIDQLQPQWRVFNEYSLGGFLAFQHKPEMIDSRMDTFDHHGVLASYLHAIHIQNSLAILHRYRIDHVLFRKDSPLVYLLLHSGQWRQVGQQNGFVLLDKQ